jgi:hypothetical protein
VRLAESSDGIWVLKYELVAGSGDLGQSQTSMINRLGQLLDLR